MTAQEQVDLGARPDFAAIAKWIRPSATVLDLGCGDGLLLKYLKETRDISGYGVEISDANVVASLRNGINVIQGNLERGLSEFEAASFDYVILSQTLQAMRHTEIVINEMLRVGRQGIVTFPNFGFWRARWQLSFSGRMPVSEELPYEWHDTPNIHLCTIRDFEDFCADHSIHVLERLVLHESKPIRLMPNLRGSLAVFRFEKAGVENAPAASARPLR